MLSMFSFSGFFVCFLILFFWGVLGFKKKIVIIIKKKMRGVRAVSKGQSHPFCHLLSFVSKP